MSRRFEVPRRLLHVDVNSPWLDEGTHTLVLKATPRGEPVDVDVIAARTAAAGIIRALGDDEGSLLVMSTHGHTGVGELALGSTAEGVLRRWHGPMLAVGSRFRPAGQPARRILFAVEPLSSPPIELVQDVRAFALRLRVPVALITVTTPAMTIDRGEQRAVVEHLEALADLLSVNDDVDVRIEPVDNTREAHTITRHADSRPGTILALATHARHPAARLVLGSVAMNVLRHTSCPVLLRRCGQPEKE
jgi:nucleotide-binding universal stress UspA family protein